MATINNFKLFIFCVWATGNDLGHPWVIETKSKPLVLLLFWVTKTDFDCPRVMKINLNCQYYYFHYSVFEKNKIDFRYPWVTKINPNHQYFFIHLLLEIILKTHGQLNGLSIKKNHIYFSKSFHKVNFMMCLISNFMKTMLH